MGITAVTVNSFGMTRASQILAEWVPRARRILWIAMNASVSLDTGALTVQRTSMNAGTTLAVMAASV